MSDNNITELPNIERSKTLAQMEEFKRNLPVLIEQQKLIAEYAFARFTALKAAGFTEAQALQLVRGGVS